MATITVANLKGGVGKSTTTINLATAAQMSGIQTAIIDVDPDQQAAAKWSDSRTAENPQVYSAVYSRLQQSITEAERYGAKLIFIDTAAFEQKILTSSIQLADLVLIPCRPTAQDVQYLTATTDIVAIHQKPAAIVLNQVEPRLPETDQARTLIASLGLSLSPMHLSKAVAYQRAIAAGLGVTEFEPTGKAAQEILSLLNWISRLLYLSPDIKVDNINKPIHRSSKI
ncbi:AAA family ATPase [Methylovulum psychrotolerans]|uniref:Cobyrinic acid a,c-diamide synthase n=1 Tax=Methylovulum psychrotolerans TaxID=1704499 RepID=A0A2S5CFN5_9GAMM|nr:AAA family ATPase [Methylovulum psychrotolerans]MBT9100475.1 AAA family ATPase [Methylovulum psychrotolerans]POZ49611.1 cobyrinic acid a,c-diamide synthase [Methylovulum psychrotolerans]